MDAPHAHTENTEELICYHDRLLAVIDESNAAGGNATSRGEKKSGKNAGKWVFDLDFARVDNNTSLKKYRGTCLRTIDTTSGAVAWEYRAAPPSRIVLSPVIRNDRVFFACGTNPLLGLDLHSGEKKTSVDTTKVYDVGHHHRCYGNRATTNFLLTGRRGVEFTSFDGGDIHLIHWLRGECRFGILPCNGLLYTTPHGCSCYYPVSYVGYGAFAGTWADEESAALESELRKPGRERLTRGSAYAAVPSGGNADLSAGNWATFRANNLRSDYAPADLRGDRLPCKTKRFSSA